jgi:uncharacterized membrane protein YhaH (DUF805 family)
MTTMQFYILAWQRSFDFSGHTSRNTFWMFMLIHILITILCIIVDIAANMATWFDTLYGILSFIPMLSAIVRRLHDTGKSGYWGFVFLVPAVGMLWLIYLLIQPTQTHDLEEQLA